MSILKAHLTLSFQSINGRINKIKFVGHRQNLVVEEEDKLHQQNV